MKDNSWLKVIGYILLIFVALFLLFKVVFPLIGLVLALLWGISGLFAFIFKAILFIILTAATCIGVALLISWLVREYSQGG